MGGRSVHGRYPPALGPSLSPETIGTERPDRLLCAILAPLVSDPPPLPGWTERAWRAAFCRPHGAHGLSALADRRLQPLLAWVASRTEPSHHLGAAAAALSVLDAAAHRGEKNADTVARELKTAAVAARPLSARPHNQARTSPSPYMERRAAPANAVACRSESPFLETAAELLDLAGYNLSCDRAFAGRLAGALDVVLGHWMTNARPGGGLPAFFSEDRLRADKRLAVRLGGDRDLLYLVYGPQPGRGRPIQEARRRGLAYWVALTWRAERLGEPVTPPPVPVLAHWRQELYRLRGAPEPAPAATADRSDAPTALG